MRVKLDTFIAPITVDSITFDAKNVKDNIIDKWLTIPIFIESGESKYGYILSEITYLETWEDDEITDLIWERLKDFEINE